MLTKKGLVIFLVGTKGNLAVFSISYILDDFTQQYEQEFRIITTEDYNELSRIRQNPYLITKSYLFPKIEPFLLPFYIKK